MTSKLKIMFPVLTMALLTACATLTQKDHVPIVIDTIPSGGECTVSASGEKIKVPGVLQLKKQCRDVEIICKKPGYEMTQRRIPYRFSKAAAGNIIFGGPVGVGIDALTGKACTFDETFKVVMNKKS